MKTVFLQFTKRVRCQSLLLMAAVTLMPVMALGQAESTATFTGNITSALVVDATNFYNSGTWNIFTTAPFETANTLNYTNVGTMYGSVGWEFDWGPTQAGQRGMSASFFNDSRGTIVAEDGYIRNPYENTPPPLASYLLISATNIINKGILMAGSAGKIVLNGKNVNLQRSTLEIGTVTATGTSYTPTNFYPDTAIYDEDWQQTNTFPNSSTPYAFDSSTIWSGSNNPVGSPTFYWDGLCGQVDAADQLGFYPTLADSTNMVASYTNIVYTNADLNPVQTNVPAHIFRQAVFVGTGDPNILVADGFQRAPGENISNLFQTITVELSSALDGNSIYLADTLGSLTNRGLLLNLDVNTGNNPLSPCSDPTYRPANYILSRLPLSLGTPGDGPPTNTFFFDPATFSNSVVQAEYSAYDAYADDLTRDPVGASVTNLPGQIVINATNLNLSRAVLYSQGAGITVRADNFEGSTGAVVACQNLSFNLGMTNAPGLVNVTNLVSYSSLPGMHGTVAAWSAVWTNRMNMVFTNYSMVTNSAGGGGAGGGGTLTNIVFTNVVEVDFHVLVVDATRLSSTVPVTVHDLILQTNAIVSDSMNVDHSFLCKGPSLTLLGTLNLSGTNLQDWNRALAPNLLYFTNSGSLSIPENAYFGGNGSPPYTAFVNDGTISVGGAESIDSEFYQCSGNETAPGGYKVTAASGKIENGAITCGGDMHFFGDNLKLNHATLYAGNKLILNLTNALYDSGGSADNTIVCANGFNMSVKPATGDLLGTAITAQAPDNSVPLIWAGENRGPTPAGYTNNEAIGRLILAPQSPSFGGVLNNNFFDFSGAGVSNAMYVDMLDLSQITNLTEMVGTDPNLVIYYAAARLPSEITVLNSDGVPVQEVETNDPLNGQTYYVVANGMSGQIPQEAEEVLNGQLNGHLRWVDSFAGPNSSVDVIINGKTYAVNRALRYSLTIDSNGDGIPNGVDPNPFNAAPLVVSGALLQPNPPTGKAFAISWLAKTNAIYQVEYNTNLLGTNWVPLLNYTNSASTNRIVTVYDTNAVSSQRFYRVVQP